MIGDASEAPGSVLKAAFGTLIVPKGRLQGMLGAFDLGYDYEEIYRRSGTIRALLNAEPYGNIVQALGG